MKVFGAHDERTGEQLEGVASRTVRVAPLADDAPVEHPLFDSPAWEHVPAEHREPLRERARSQLGTTDVHGAGWVMSRTEAAGTRGRRRRRKRSRGSISAEMVHG